MSIDWTLLNGIHTTLQCGFLDFVMPKITLLGDKGAVWIIAAVIMMFTKKYRRYGIMLIIGLAAGVLVGNAVLKNLIARPRPCWIDTNVNLLIANPTDYSFPSGHTLSSTIGATIIMYANRKIGIAAVIMAVLIAFSRLYLYVHYPSDILGGAVLGMAIGMSVYALTEYVLGRYADKRKA